MQIESFKLNFRENARSRTDHGADIITWPVLGDSPVHPHLLRSSVSLNDSLATAGLPRSHTTPALLSSQEQGGGVGSLTGLRTEAVQTTVIRMCLSRRRLAKVTL
ncbi:hypothetical protein G5714_023123 [Onychostoma macrolepis]|uniref:Uncharacterized protein n=1 Tax=Onychostoma macrolepis TaxID=369639 RepID=A0A7J6BK70_9TELE|nr:hypothetical protein G5714_023123 [Onychostoma macrolepis]